MLVPRAVMSLLALYGISLVGTVVWVANPEVAAALCVARGGLPPIAVGLVAAAGQMTTAMLLFRFGAELRRRWRWFDARCARVRERAGARLGRNASWVMATSGLVGVPPVAATATLAAGMGIPVAHFVPIVLLTRVIRFTAIALLAAHAHVGVLGR
jgi:membrane protein YqaA with SNARE-associated domain